MSRNLVIVGNVNCRRVGFWQSALARRRWPAASVVPYSELLRRRTCLLEHLSHDALVRFESAAEDWDTFKLLLEHGSELALRENYPALGQAAIASLEYDRGWLIRPRQCYLGFTRILRSLSQEVEASSAQVLNHGDEIAICFDKRQCQERLWQHGLPIPVMHERVHDYAELRARHRLGGRIMVKLTHGSGGAGCMALHWSRNRVYALTTIAEVVVRGESRLYCSKRTRCLQDEGQIAALINRLCVEGIQVEEWLPKARWEGLNFDLRVVTIGGVPRHTMARRSASPFTNLTLGNPRANTTPIIQRIGPRHWQRIRETCASVAALFPNSFTLGIDVLVRPNFQRHAVLEVNAFGDLLLRQLDNGEDTYTATLSAWERKTEGAQNALVMS